MSEALRTARALLAQGRPDEALAQFDAALAVDAGDLAARANRASALAALDRFVEALTDLDAVLAVRPDLATAENNRAAVLAELGRYDEALASFERALALAPHDADTQWNRALLLLRLGRFAEGWEAYEWRKRKREPLGRRPYPQPEWTGQEPLAGRTIFLHWEQGLGDTLQFVRYAPLVAARGATVAVSVQAPLVRLLKQLEPAVTVLGPNQRPAQFDFHAPLLSLPRAFGTTLSSIPPAPRLSADPALAAAWRERLGAPSRRRIGLAWRGNPGHVNDRRRSIDLARLAPFLFADVDWISLQNAPSEVDRQALADSHLRDVAEFLGDFADTAALIEQLDLVITVDTAVAHLAGAMGKPVWILLPFNPDWRWLVGRQDSPWHPSARLFRQPAPGDWVSVVRGVADELG